MALQWPWCSPAEVLDRFGLMVAIAVTRPVGGLGCSRLGGGWGGVLAAVAGAVPRVVGAGVVGPDPGLGGPVIADCEAGDLVGEVGAGGELAAPADTSPPAPADHTASPAGLQYPDETARLTGLCFHGEAKSRDRSQDPWSGRRGVAVLLDGRMSR